MDSLDVSFGLVDFNSSTESSPQDYKSKDVDAKVLRTKLWKCEVCGCEIKSKKANYDRHMKLHDSLVMYLKCSTCGQNCSNDYNFNIHCIRKHTNEPKPTAAVRWYVTTNF